MPVATTESNAGAEVACKSWRRERASSPCHQLTAGRRPSESQSHAPGGTFCDRIAPSRRAGVSRRGRWIARWRATSRAPWQTWAPPLRGIAEAGAVFPDDCPIAVSLIDLPPPQVVRIDSRHERRAETACLGRGSQGWQSGCRCFISRASGRPVGLHVKSCIQLPWIAGVSAAHLGGHSGAKINATCPDVVRRAVPAVRVRICGGFDRGLHDEEDSEDRPRSHSPRRRKPRP